MKIFVYQIQLYLPHVHSLKEKRGVIKHFQNQLQKNFNISIAEVNNHDIWQTTTIGISGVGTETQQLQKSISHIQNFIEQNFPEMTITEENYEFL